MFLRLLEHHILSVYQLLFFALFFGFCNLLLYHCFLINLLVFPFSPSLSTSAYLSAQLFSGEFATALKMFLEPLLFARKHIFVWHLLNSKHSTSSIWWSPLPGDDKWTRHGPPVTGHLIVYSLWIVGVASKILLPALLERRAFGGEKILSSCLHVQWKKEGGVSFRILIF